MSPTGNEPCIGIDLGTTYSLVSVFSDGAPQVLETSSGSSLLPSVIGFDGERMLVGEAARVRAETLPATVRATFKRDMGTQLVYALGRQRLSPVECSALVLGELKATAERALGRSLEHAVVSVPAYFGERQRNATRDAAKLAGLSVGRLINEPTAAALAYGLHHRDREFKAVVLDLGGGTFDVTVLEMLEGVIEIQGSAGDIRLGGEDFLDALVADVTHQMLGKSELSAPDAARLRVRLEVAKRDLSQLPELELEFSTLDRGSSHRGTLTRKHAEALWAPLLQRMRAPILRALRDAKTDPKDVGEVLLVGGATRMPCVVGLARELFGRDPETSLPPDEAVALGAAVQAALLTDDAAVREVVMTDIAPFTLGVEVGNKFGQHVVQGAFSPIIERGTLLPASRSSLYAPLDEKQTKIELKVFQGEHSDCAKNTQLGTITVRDIPPAPAEREVEVRFTYDLSGVLDVDCIVLATKKAFHLTLDQSGRLPADEVEAVRKRLQSLKFHPREALPNVTLLGKADALFAELTGVPRSILAGEIQAFRGALESQDVSVIDAARKGLADTVRTLKPRG